MSKTEWLQTFYWIGIAVNIGAGLAFIWAARAIRKLNKEYRELIDQVKKKYSL